MLKQNNVRLGTLEYELKSPQNDALRGRVCAKIIANEGTTFGHFWKFWKSYPRVASLITIPWDWG